jgi:hypothetical protein
METKGSQRHHQAQAGQQSNGGGDQEASAPIGRDRRSTADRNGRERAKFSKKKFTEVRIGSYWHRRPPDAFGNFERSAKKQNGMLAGERNRRGGVTLICELPFFTGQSEATAKR